MRSSPRRRSTGAAASTRSRCRKRDGTTIRLPGQGGMADVANMHRDYVLYLTRHSPQSVVEAVETASSARGLLTKAERSAAGYRTGRALVFTDLCVFRLDQATRQLVVVETMPGVSEDAIRAQTGFAVAFDADCRARRAARPGSARLSPAPHRSARAAAGWNSSAPASAGR